MAFDLKSKINSEIITSVSHKRSCIQKGTQEAEKTLSEVLAKQT